MNWQRVQQLGTKSVPYLTVIFLIIVVTLLYNALASLKWQQMANAIHQLDTDVVLFALAAVFLNHCIFSSYDFLATIHLKVHPIAWPKIVASSFVCYIFNFNMGSLIGGIGFRYRLYSGWHISKRKISMIIVFSGITTWMGYILVLGLILLLASAEHISWPNMGPSLRLGIGLIALTVPATYFYCCLTHKSINLKEMSFNLPHAGMALAQLTLSTLQWCLPSLIIYFFLKTFGASLTYAEVLWTFILAAVAALITHIPAGLGVLVAIFLKLHPEHLPENLIAALLCYRAVYYLLPLLFAIPTYVFLELYQKKSQIIHSSSMQKSS